MTNKISILQLRDTGFEPRGCKVFTQAVCSLGLHRDGYLKPFKRYRASRACRLGKGEVRNIYFPKTQKREERRICSMIYNNLRSCPTKSFRLLGYLGETVSLFKKARRQPYYIYALVYLSPLESNYTICKELRYSIMSLFTII